jgi:hypothetical protein
MQSLMELPGTTGIAELRQRAEDLTTWKLSLQRGCEHLFKLAGFGNFCTI